MKFERIIRELNSPQPLDPDTHNSLLGQFLALVENREAGIDICGNEVERKGIAFSDQGDAVIPVSGVLGRHLRPLERMGATDYLELHAEVKQARDQGARTLTLEIDSPGGMFQGLPEAAYAIRNAGIPTVAMVSGIACSAAYWLASQCDKIVGTPSSMAGSIGTTSQPRIDISQPLAQAGVKVWHVHVGKHKNPGGFPEVGMTEEQFDEAMQRAVYVNDMFKQAVLSRRPHIKAEDMEGQVYTGMEGLRRGFFDLIIDTTDEYSATEVVQH